MASGSPGSTAVAMEVSSKRFRAQLRQWMAQQCSKKLCLSVRFAQVRAVPVGFTRGMASGKACCTCGQTALLRSPRWVLSSANRQGRRMS